MSGVELLSLKHIAVELTIFILALVFLIQLKIITDASPSVVSDRSLWYFICAIIIWLIMALIRQLVPVNLSELRYWTLSLLSLANDLFLIWGITMLDYAPRQIRSARRKLWPIFLVLFVLCAEIFMYLTINVATSPIRYWQIPGICVSLFVGVLLILGFINSFREYGFRHLWLIVSSLFLSIWVFTQPLWIINQSITNWDLEGWLVIISTAGKTSFVISLIVLAASRLYNIVNQGSTESLFFTPGKILEQKSEQKKVPSLGSKGEELFKKYETEIRARYGIKGYVAINVDSENITIDSWAHGLSLQIIAEKICSKFPDDREGKIYIKKIGSFAKEKK